MTSEGNSKRQVARGASAHSMLERLKPGEAAAILRRLLEAHPNLSAEADGIARSLLHQVDYQEVAAEIEDEIRALDYEDLNARAGSHEWGYVEPSEAAVPTNILVQFEMIELIEGFLLVFPAHVYSSSLRNFQYPIVVSISRSPAG